MSIDHTTEEKKKKADLFQVKWENKQNVQSLLSFNSILTTLVFFSISLPLMHTYSLHLKHGLDFSKFTEQALCEALNEKILGKERGKKTSVSPANSSSHSLLSFLKSSSTVLSIVFFLGIQYIFLDYFPLFETSCVDYQKSGSVCDILYITHMLPTHPFSMWRRMFLLCLCPFACLPWFIYSLALSKLSLV